MAVYYCPLCGRTVDRPDEKSRRIKSLCMDKGKMALLIRVGKGVGEYSGREPR